MKKAHEPIDTSSQTLIVGANGLIGRALFDELQRQNRRAVGTVHRLDAMTSGTIHLDLTSEPSTWKLPEDIRVAFLCAGITSLEACRREPRRTALINVERTQVLAETLAERGVFTIAFSTNLVFDGSLPHSKAEEHLNPQTEYGRQKAALENGLTHLGQNVSVVRLTKILGNRMPLFEGWCGNLRNGQVIHPFADMRFAPVPLTFLVRALLEIATRRCTGVIQISPQDEITYADAARLLLEELRAAPECLQAIRWADEELRLEHVPTHTTLDASRLQHELGTTPPTAVEAVREWARDYSTEREQS